MQKPVMGQFENWQDGSPWDWEKGGPYRGLTSLCYGYNIGPPNNNPGGPMTIIMGALAKGGEQVVVVSDKLTSSSILTDNIPKMRSMGPKLLVLTSGIVQNYLFLDDCGSNNKTISDVKENVDIIAKAYREFRLNKFQQDVLPLYGMLSLNEFYGRQKTLNDFLAGSISEQIKIYNIWVDLIVAGIDKMGHVYHIGHPGGFSCEDVVGYCCAGSASPRSLPVFEFYRYSKDLSLEQVKLICFFAKKRSEQMSGIGVDTEIKIISEDGITNLSAEEIKTLNGSFLKEKRKNPSFY